jgi:T-complex protein 1 subunit zeta
MSLQSINPNAASVKGSSARAVVTNASRGLAETLSSNLGPKGTMKMLVSGAGDIKLTKDGSVLLGEMQFQHPIAQMIARAVTAQDDMAGDGTTSTVLFIGELMRLADYYMRDGVHVRSIVEGYTLAKEETLRFLDTFKKPVTQLPSENREAYVRTAFTALNTKLEPSIAQDLAEVCVDAVNCIHTPGKPIDLHMVEIMVMQHKLKSDSQYIQGLVLDHGTRHPDMPRRLENCFILTCNASLEYEKSEVNAEWSYTTASMKEKMMRAERKVVDDNTRKILALKREVCTEGQGFVVINQKGVDPLALDMLAKEGIMALRRAKKRNMERLVLACGGVAVNSFDGLTINDLGRATAVYEHILGEEKYTFVEAEKPESCTVLIKGPNKHTLGQLKDAVRDGLRAVKCTLDDMCVVPGAGAFEVAALCNLEDYLEKAQGHVKIGVRAFGEALTIIPRTLCSTAGRDDAAYVLIELQEAHKAAKKKGTDECFGVDTSAGGITDTNVLQLFDSYRSKRYMVNTSAEIASQLMLVDEIMKAGVQRGGRGPGPQG